MNNTFEHGSINISENAIHIFGTTLNLSNVDNMDILEYKRRSLFANIGTWFGGLIIVTIICGMWTSLQWIFAIYLFSIFLIIAYNIFEYRKKYYGITIQTSARKTIVLKSLNKEFINKIHNIIVESINTKNANFTINLDSHDIINNGIVSKGNKNKMVINND